MNATPREGRLSITLPSFRRLAFDLSLEPPAMLAIGIALAGVILFFEIQIHLRTLLWRRPEYIPPVLIAAIVGAFAFVRADYRHFPIVFTVLARTTAAGLVAALIFEPPNSALADPAFADLAEFINWSYWVVLAVAGLSIWRPSFLFPAGLYLVAARFAANYIAGYGSDDLDIRYMSEMAQFLGLSACGISVLRFFSVRESAPKHVKALSSDDLRLLALCIAFITMGFHLANYFWSGWAKLALGPHFWSWAFLNHTQNLMLGALKTRVLIFGHWPWITQEIFDAFGAVVIFSNVAVVVVQVFALFAPLRLRWITISSWCYDALHVGIFFIGGLFFWPWIWNNLSIMRSAHRSSDREVGWEPRICCILTILLGGWIGGSARLAWWDVADFRTPTIQAEAEDGTWVDVPLSFFLSQAYAMGHAQENQAVTTGHYLPTDSWGSAMTYDRLQSSGTCPTAPEIAKPESPADRAKRLDRFGRFLRAHHRKMLALADESGYYNFYVARLFHLPSNYWMNEKFNTMNIRKIKHYRLLTQSICYKVVDGHLVEHVVKEDAVVFDVGE